ITIEDETMAVWYFSRGHSAKSPDFNFITNHRNFVRLMLGFLLASHQQLGYDPTILRRVDVQHQGKRHCFVLRLGERLFKTVWSIFDHRSLCVTGRATRVWKVVEVGSSKNLEPLPGSQPMVLKDVWLNNEAMTESQNFAEISAQLEKIAAGLEAGEDLPILNHFKPKAKKRLEDCLRDGSWHRYFLTKICDWQGCKSVEVADGAEPYNGLFDEPRSDVKPAAPSLSTPCRESEPRPTDLGATIRVQHPRDYHPKRQYRVVYQEVCQALHDVKRLQDVVTVLEDCSFALQLMYLAGWVHRDISSGNVYLHTFVGEDNNQQSRGIFAELEYAKAFKETKSSLDPKTGTAYFMAVEIQRQRLLGLTTEQETLPTEEEFLADTPDKPPPVHNKAGYKQAMGSVFQDTSNCPQGREDIITLDGVLATFLDDWLDPRLGMNGAFTRFRSILRVQYNSRWARMEDMPSYVVLYGYLDLLFEKLRQAANMNLPDLVTWNSSQDSTAGNILSQASRPAQVAIKRKPNRDDD
ncbi:hypothetical protein FRB90_009164, partial [Tulasnella sp. 427]